MNLNSGKEQRPWWLPMLQAPATGESSCFLLGACPSLGNAQPDPSRALPAPPPPFFFRFSDICRPAATCTEPDLTRNSGKRRTVRDRMSELCSNRGCGLRFEPHGNTRDACRYHPGVPIFHDALKGWSCCKKKTTDFSEFLAIPGCTRGHHSNVKSPEPLKTTVTCTKDGKEDLKPGTGTESIMKGPKSAELMMKERPSSDEPMVKLPQRVSKSLQESLDKLSESIQKTDTKKEDSVDGGVEVGTLCKNNGCQKTFQGPASDREMCSFHPGIPIFHEGMKYWSCCKIKTTEFDEFLEQPGCVRSKHIWKKKESDKKLVSCRHDWHQTGNLVVLTVYAKTSNPVYSYVDANQTMLTVHIMFEKDKIFHKVLNLWGVVDTSKSFVNIGPTKVEINLQKMDPVTWAKLELPAHKVEEKEEKKGKEESQKQEVNKSPFVAQELNEMYLGDEPPPLEDDESDDSLGLSDTDEEFD
ncbi:cysteine and histidine-rich domain-containing protein 1-like [Narcine bancroftii]|uniref:cysteine and histidine-rich domain-containing protein 1-like n=1 Tax=Narcine bancroftii TaxID=1343680 RepID=UPI0038314A8E